MDDFGEKFMHNKETNLRNDGLNITAFNHWLKFVNVYTFINVLTCTQSQLYCNLCIFSDMYMYA